MASGKNRPVKNWYRLYAIGDVEFLRSMCENISAKLNAHGKQRMLDWLAIEVLRTWCKAETYKSSGVHASEGFHARWNDDL